jgi:DNA-binding NarL/FixJ family response regulator
MIRVLIVDDQVIVCAGLQVILSASPAITVVGVAHNGADAVKLAAQLQPDVVLMDLNMPVMSGVQAIRALRGQQPQIAVIALTTYDDDSWVVDAIRAGAAGYLLKDTGQLELVAAIEGVMAGRSPLDPAVAGKLMRYVRQGAPPTDIDAQLSERERAVLRLLASGLSNAAIADRLALAEGTVKNHVTALFAKLDVTDRAQATAYAWRHGLVSPDDGPS